MKTMKNFAAQQLTKTQMNEVKGGWRCFVVLEYSDAGNKGYFVDVPGSSASEASANLGRVEGAVGHAC